VDGRPSGEKAGISGTSGESPAAEGMQVRCRSVTNSRWYTEGYGITGVARPAQCRTGMNTFAAAALPFGNVEGCVSRKRCHRSSDGGPRYGHRVHLDFPAVDLCSFIPGWPAARGVALRISRFTGDVISSPEYESEGDCTLCLAGFALRRRLDNLVLTLEQIIGGACLLRVPLVRGSAPTASDGNRT
jgi:hypothetical protein